MIDKLCFTAKIGNPKKVFPYISLKIVFSILKYLILVKKREHTPYSPVKRNINCTKQLFNEFSDHPNI